MHFLAAAAALAAGAAQTAVAATRYYVVELPTLGGKTAQGSSINQFGLVAGFSTLTGDQTIHAAAWRFGVKQDLGTLGGANSAVLWPVKNDFGVISGIAESDQPNPLNEPWSCSDFIPSDGHACLGFIYRSGKLRALQPLPGGYNSFATGTNNRMQTVGWAETGLHDASCDPASGQVLQFLPVIWGPDNAIKALPLEAGDDSGSATVINDLGQVAGISGKCDQAAGRYSAIHMLLWQNGGYTDLGNLGGDAWNTPMAINELGHVAGFANIAPGGRLNENAFLWTHDMGIRSLGVLYPGDVHSQALGINDRDQVVGLSCTAHFATCHGFLWQNGSMTDLNTLASGYSGTIVDAQDINDLGEITGQALDASGDLVAFLAIPIPSWNTSAQPAAKHDASLTPKSRSALLQRLGLGRPDALGQIH